MRLSPRSVLWAVGCLLILAVVALFSLLHALPKVSRMIRALLIVSAVLGLLGGVQTYRIHRLKSEIAVVKVERDAAKAFAESLQTVAREDAAQNATQCQKRVDEARRSAQRIETIIERPYAVDPQGCPVRALLDSGSLREALQPNAPAAQPVQ